MNGATFKQQLQTAISMGLPSYFSLPVPCTTIDSNLMMKVDIFQLRTGMDQQTLDALQDSVTYYLIVQIDTKEYSTKLEEDLADEHIKPWIKGANSYANYFEVRIRTNIESYY